MCSYRQIFISLPLSLRWVNYNISLKIYQVFFQKNSLHRKQFKRRDSRRTSRFLAFKRNAVTRRNENRKFKARLYFWIRRRSVAKSRIHKIQSAPLLFNIICSLCLPQNHFYKLLTHQVVKFFLCLKTHYKNK